MSQLAETVRTGFAGRRVVILGDAVADQFLHGTISRVSREAPVFILDHDSTDTRAGGAANAAVNVASLGGTPVLVGLIGSDLAGSALKAELTSSNVICDHLIESTDVQTTTKVRVLAGQHYAPRQQVIRIDYANRSAVTDHLRAAIAERFSVVCENADAIIISDYNYGVADGPVFETALRLASERGIPLLIDSRFRLSNFKNATAGTPNQEEVEQLLGPDPTPESCDSLRQSLGYGALLVTAGNKGMTLYEAGQPPRHFDAVGAKEPVDVTGAGDTVIGAFALGLASGLSFGDAASVANHAGGIVVMKRGTASVTRDELLNSLESEPGNLSHATRS
ncbi:MAG TPA: PfkB family carbohydrate kinase [Pyrinomonadaceae bacterium]|nr:PfkB family carbohydrate kinase [Pyrinomonadaceae bacterium]